MRKQLKRIPKFANEDEERSFWESPKNDSTEYVDWRMSSTPSGRMRERSMCPINP